MMNDFSSWWRALWHSMRVQMKLSMARETFKFVVLIYPFTFSTLGILMYGTAAQDKVLDYVILGSGFVTLWSSIVFSSASDVNRERYYGTLEIVFNAPVSFSITMIGKILGNMLWGLISMVLSFVYLLIFYRVDVQIHHPGLLLASLCFVLISLGVVAFFLAMLFTLSRQAEALANLMQFPIYLLCGFMFPVAHLPDWLHPVSYSLTPTWGIELLRQATKASLDYGGIWQSVIYLMALNILLLFLGMFGYRQLEKKVRCDGNLGVY